MTIKTFIKVLGTSLVLSFNFTAVAADADSTVNNAILLLNVESSGPLSVRDLEFTNVDTEVKVRIRDVESLGRYTGSRFIMKEIPAGLYYLSAIYPAHNRNDASPAIEIDEDNGSIVILANTINYIGDVIVKTEEVGQRISALVAFEANSRTLAAAVASEREKFESMRTVVSIASYDPVLVYPKLLGL